MKLPSPVSEIMLGDPLVNFILGRGVRLPTIVFMGMAYGFGYAIVLPMIYGTLDQVLVDWPEVIRILLVTPLLFGYYIWQPLTIQNLYDLATRRVVGQTTNELEKISQLSQPLRNRLWFWLAIVFGVLNSIVYYNSLLRRTYDWQNSESIIIVMSTLAAFMSFYSVILILIRQIVIFRGINKFFQIIDVDIAPLHPDKAGGLRSLGQYVVTIGLGIGIIGLALGVSLLRFRMGLEVIDTVFYVGLVVYLLIAPIFFFIPLAEAHSRMKQAKEKILVEVAGQYEKLYTSALQKMKAGKLTDRDLAQMDAVRKMYAIADDSPVWPFNFDVLSKFSAAVLLPVVLPLIVNYITVMITQ